MVKADFFLLLKRNNNFLNNKVWEKKKIMLGRVAIFCQSNDIFYWLNMIFEYAPP